MSLRFRIFLNTLIILLLGMGTAALLVWRAVEGMYIDTQRENLLAQARISAETLRGQSISSFNTSTYSQTANAMPGIHARLLSDRGAVLEVPLNQPYIEDQTIVHPAALITRPEVANALQGKADTAIRAVLERRVLYAAAPVLDDRGTVIGLVYLAMPLPAAGLPLNLVWELATALLVSVIFALLAGTFLSRRITQPIEGISQAAASLNLTDQVAANSGIIELDGLARAFNHMTEAISQSDQAKNAFIADVTHELRTPLTVIKGTIETLEDGALDDVEGRAPLLSSMQRETDRLIRMVNDLLVLTRADAGTLRLNIQTLDLSEAARARCQHLSALAARRGVAFTVTGADPAPVQADADRIAQVLDNLLENALRYSPAGSVIAVEIAKDDENIRCAVKDTGPGIPQKHLPFIFDRFYRVDASRNRQTGGAGLGLAIVRALVLAQGGAVHAESVEGQGTTIVFCLPIDQ